MTSTWEYLTVPLRIVASRERPSGYFSHRALQVGLDEEGRQTLSTLGREGWELVAVVPASGAGAPSAVLAFFKRPVGGPVGPSPSPATPGTPVR